MATNSKRIERILGKALGTVKRKRGFPKIQPNIDHVHVIAEKSFRSDLGILYPFTAIVSVLKYPTENQMDWFKKWNSELADEYNINLNLESVFFDESGDLYYVFSGINVKK